MSFKLRKGIQVSLDPIRCTCGLGNLEFYLPVNGVSSAKTKDGADIPREDMAITIGSSLRTGSGFVNDFLKIIGICKNCRVEHTAILVVKNGLVHGLEDRSITPLTTAAGSKPNLIGGDFTGSFR